MLLFSDLHLSPKTFETSLKVLRRVHHEALSRNVPVGFLGDFFDHVYNKGTLPVDILNKLLRFFADEWHVPMIMIPGNHDYFDASETEHGLTPFKYASTYITVIDEPTVFNNRLWMPWRRDPVVCKRIIDAHPGVDAIFGHFDIIGFKLNAKRISTEGLSLEMFPQDMPVYTGHYHTPQSYRRIVYLGSPYQLSLSEAEDKKALIVLDEKADIACKIPIDIGRKQYKWTPSELLARSAELRSNDRVSITGMPSVALVRELREKGILIDVKRQLPEIQTRIAEPDAMSEKQLLHEYAKLQSIDTSSEAWIQMNVKVDALMSGQCATTYSLKRVEPIRMNISGFGPFTGPVVISLQGQGFTLISGEMNGSDASNGAGKSMVTAGAFLWAFTGMIDGRNHMSFENGFSVTHNGEGPACITLMGDVDQKPFKITRSLSVNPRKHSLQFSIGNVDRTRSTLTATQRAISEEIIGMGMSASELLNWMLRNCCWSQQHVNRFCDASDSQAKLEIQTLANMDMWNSLHKWAKETAKEIVDELVRIDIEQKAGSEQYDAAVERHTRALRMHAEWQKRIEIRLEQNREDTDKIRSSLARLVCPDIEPKQPVKSVLMTYQRNLRDARECSIRAQTRKKTILESLPCDWQSYPAVAVPKDIGAAKMREEQCKSTMTARRVQLNVARKSLDDFQTNSICSACNRPFQKQTMQVNHLRTLKDTMEVARVHHASASGDWKEAATTLKHLKQQWQQYEQYTFIQKSSAIVQDIEQQLTASNVHDLEKHVEELQDAYERDYQQFREYHQQMRQKADLGVALEALYRVREATVAETSPYDQSDEEVSKCLREKRELSLLACKKRLQQQHVKQIVRWTGSKGIQTYVMEHTVKKLAAKTSHWLQKFFGEDCCLQAGFDSKERLIRRVLAPGLSGVMSGGQWRRVQIASFLAWKSMKADSWPLLIMDEACTSMDQAGISAIQEILKDWCEEDPLRTCYFISHEPGQFRDTSMYQNHIRVQNKRGRSSLVASDSSKRRKK